MEQAKKRKILKIVVGILILAAMAGGGIFLVLTKPWIASVKEIGKKGSMTKSASHMAVLSKKYQYYIDLDGSLRLTVWDREQGAFLPGESDEIIFARNEDAEGDCIEGIQVTKKKVYLAYYGGTDREGNALPGAMIAMNHDGTKQKELFAIGQETSVPTYVKMSNGAEYFYYTAEGDLEAEEESRLYRYNVKKDCVETVIPEDVQWYGFQGESLYYGCFSQESQTVHSYRALLNGEEAVLVDDKHGYCDMFLADGQIYMLQTFDESGAPEEGIVACDKALQPEEDGTKILGIPVKGLEFSVGEGTLFYGDKESKTLYKVPLNGTAKEAILQGYQYKGLCYEHKMLYFRDGKISDIGEFVAMQSYFAAEDGSALTALKLERNSQVTENGLCYMKENGKVVILGYQGDSEEVIVPAEIDGLMVEGIDLAEIYSAKVPKEKLHIFTSLHESQLIWEEKDGNAVIKKCLTDAQNLAIPSEIGGRKVTEIGEYAFYGCTNLTRVIFPNTLKVIGSYAFGKCSFAGQDLVIPEGVTEIQKGSFAQCIPNSILLPSTLERVGTGFLEGCGGEYKVASGNPEFTVKDGVIFSVSGKILYAFPYLREGAYEIPQGVEVLWGGAFESCRIKEVTLPEGLRKIGEKAFWYSSLETINPIPESVEAIESKAFVKTNLTEIFVGQETVVVEDSFDRSMQIHIPQQQEEDF